MEELENQLQLKEFTLSELRSSVNTAEQGYVPATDTKTQDHQDALEVDQDKIVLDSN